MLDCMNPIYLPLPNSEIPEYASNVAFLIIQEKYWTPNSPSLLHRTPDSSVHTYITIQQATSASREIIGGRGNIVYPKKETNEVVHRGTLWMELL
jgi:hypothetical protein